MNRAERRDRSRVTCEAEVAFTDFDGTRASAPCGERATRLVLFFTRQGWLTGAPRTADTVRACPLHTREAHAGPLDYGLEAVVSRPL